jgi:uncharacterized protein (DUF433 family)
MVTTMTAESCLKSPKSETSFINLLLTADNLRITIGPGKRSGKPCTRGIWLTVSNMLEYLAAGMSVAEILSDFTELTAEDIHACLAFAAERERRLLTIRAP